MPRPRANQRRSVAAFIGRFQPVHWGHIAGIQRLAQQHPEIHIVVASYPQTSRLNPLTSREAKYLLIKSLQEVGVDLTKVRVSIIRQPKQYKSDSLFFIHAELRRRIGQPFTFYTGNRTVYDILHSRGLDVQFFERVKPKVPGKARAGIGKELTASNIRELIASGRDWEHLLPSVAVKIIKQRGLHHRIKELHQAGKDVHAHYK